MQDMAKRKSFSAPVRAEVLVKCRRRCALCYGLDGDTSERRGQLAHIDRDALNASLENAAFLCLKHHEAYDSESRQAKGFDPEQLRRHQRDLHEYLEKVSEWPDVKKMSRSAVRKIHRSRPIGLDVYNVRMPIYRTAVNFVREVLKDLRPDMPTILQFTRDTEDALFLYDEKISDYLAVLFKRALRLHTVAYLIAPPRVTDDFRQLVNEELELAVWFSEQIGVIRAMFAPFLRLS